MANTILAHKVPIHAPAARSIPIDHCTVPISLLVSHNSDHCKIALAVHQVIPSETGLTTSIDRGILVTEVTHLDALTALPEVISVGTLGALVVQVEALAERVSRLEILIDHTGPNILSEPGVTGQTVAVPRVKGSAVRAHNLAQSGPVVQVRSNRTPFTPAIDELGTVGIRYQIWGL